MQGVGDAVTATLYEDIQPLLGSRHLVSAAPPLAALETLNASTIHGNTACSSIYAGAAPGAELAKAMSSLLERILEGSAWGPAGRRHYRAYSGIPSCRLLTVAMAVPTPYFVLADMDPAMLGTRRMPRL